LPYSHLDVITELPSSVYRNIGKIISAHAFLETQILHLLFDLSDIEYSVGRVTIKYQSASEQFKLVRRLLALHGIPTKVGLGPLLKRIERCCKTRDSFAHGVWVRMKNNAIGLRLTKGEYEIEAGLADRSFVPQVSSYSNEWCEDAQHEALELGYTILGLQSSIKEVLASRHGKS
jgi:hypothetical protein